MSPRRRKETIKKIKTKNKNKKNPHIAPFETVYPFVFILLFLISLKFHVIKKNAKFFKIKKLRLTETEGGQTVEKKIQGRREGKKEKKEGEERRRKKRREGKERKKMGGRRRKGRGRGREGAGEGLGVGEGEKLIHVGQ